MQSIITLVNSANLLSNQKNLYQLSHSLLKFSLTNPEELTKYITRELTAQHSLTVKDRFLFQLLTMLFRNNTRNDLSATINLLEKALNTYSDYKNTPSHLMYQGALSLLQGKRASAFSLYQQSAHVANKDYYGLPRLYLGANSITSPISDAWVDSEKRLPGIVYNLLKPKDSYPPFTLLFAADTNYYNNFHKDILSDLKNFHGDYQIHFHVVDWNNSISTKVIDKYSLTIEKFKYFRDRTYFACVRFYRAIEFLQKCNTSLFISDIDNEIIKDPMLFFADMENYDVGLRLNSNSNWFPWWGPSAGSLYIANNKHGRLFAQLLKNYISANYRVNKYSLTWWFDQLAINETYQYCLKNHPEIKFADLNKINFHLSVVRKDTNLLQNKKWTSIDPSVV